MPRGFTSQTYRRRSVEREVEEFEGWAKVLERYGRIQREQGFAVSQVYAAAFLTGGRITEVLTLKPEMFLKKQEVVQLSDGRTIARDILEVNKMMLEKRYKKLENWVETREELPDNAKRRLFVKTEKGYSRRRFKTERLASFRKPFDIPLDEVPKDSRKMHEDLVWHLSASKGQPWLFPSSIRRTHMSRSFIWKKFNLYGIFPHYLRAQRASCLITWNGLSMEQMMEWMSWEEMKTAMHYGKMGKSKLLGVFRRYE